MHSKYKNKATFRLRRNDLVLFKDEKGFSPVIIAGVVLVIAVIVGAILFFKQSTQTTTTTNSDIPPGIVVDTDGAICETQDATYCHESEDIDTWKDDGLP